MNTDLSQGTPQKAGSRSSKIQESNEKTPLLFVDVNLGSESERIVVYEGDTARDLAVKFCEEHGLDDDTLETLEQMLQGQIASVLTKIEEEENDSNVYSH
jgi:hypothetical protein